MENILLIIYCLIFYVSVGFTGSFITRILKVKPDNKFELLIYNFSFGSILFSLIFLYLGMFHLLYKDLLLALYLLPIFIWLITIITKSKIFTKKNKSRVLKSYDIWILLLILFILFPLIPYLFLYPASWDPLAYHLTLPKLYLNLHYFPVLENFPQTAYTIGIESLYGFGEIMKDPRFSNILNFVFLLMSLLYINFGLRDLFDKKILIFTSLLFALRHILYSEVAITPFVDYGFAFFSLVGSVALYRFLRSGKISSLTVAVVIFLFLPLIKLTGFFILFSALFVILISGYIKNIKGKKLRLKINRTEMIRLLFIALIILLPLLFWFIRNYIYTRNPFFPFFNGIFKGLDFDPSALSQIEEIKQSNLIFSIAKWNFLHGMDGIADYNFLADVLGFIVLLGFSLWGIVSKRHELRYISLFAAMSSIAISVFVGPLSRYLLPLIPIMAIIAFEKVFNIEKINIIKLLLVVLLIGVIYIQVDLGFNQRDMFFTQKPKLIFLSYFSYKYDLKNLKLQDNYSMVDYVNKNLDKNKDNLLVVFDNRLYYYDIPADFDNPSLNGYFTNPNTKDVSEIYTKMKTNKITYVFINKNWGTYKNLRTDLYEDFIKKYLAEVRSEKGINDPKGLVLYKVK